MFNKTFRRRKSFSNTFTLSPRNLNSTISHIETIVFRIICALVTKSLIAKLQYPIIFIYFCHAQAITTSFRYILRETSSKKKNSKQKSTTSNTPEPHIFAAVHTVESETEAHKFFGWLVEYWLSVSKFVLQTVVCSTWELNNRANGTSEQLSEIYWKSTLHFILFG